MISYKKALRKAIDRYRTRAQEDDAEGPGVQLACLVLADYCTRRCLEDGGGPTLEMIMLAESTVGESINTVVYDLMKGDV